MNLFRKGFEKGSKVPLGAGIVWALLAVSLLAGILSGCAAASSTPPIFPESHTPPLLLETSMPQPAAIADQAQVTLLFVQAFTATPSFTSEATFTAAYTPTASDILTPTPEPVVQSVRFAAIGDYGLAGEAARQVSELVKSWEVDFVITTGDNNYPNGEASTIDENIGQYYHEFIHPYKGAYGEGAAYNRFFPSMGNHDWLTEGARPYLDYFELPGNERYYDFTWGAVHLFALNGDYNEPDGVGRSSQQANWLQERLAASQHPWKVVYFHHAPYSSGYQGGTDWMRWPFKEWGASAVLAGHDHTYERLLIDDLPYFVNGLGGGAIYPFVLVEAGSQVRYNRDYGAMLVEATPEWMAFQFITRSGILVDEYVLHFP